MLPRSSVLLVALLLICSCAFAQTPSRYIHVFVALADNEHQGIVPVPATLGNGDDPARNLYWGAAFGVRTFFRHSPEWKEALLFQKPSPAVLERSVFKNQAKGVMLIADAYRGSEIKQALTDFFRAAAGMPDKEAVMGGAIGGVIFQDPSVADLVVYVGHDGLMDFPVTVDFAGHANTSRPAIVLACASKSFFRDNLRASGATPLLWTTGLMAPEAYTLKAAVDGWMAGESRDEIRRRAAEAYAKYQKISDGAALRLFSSDW